MYKKLVADLTSLAHGILQMKDPKDIPALKQKAHGVYEKLLLLSYVEEYLQTTPNATETKEELLEKIEHSLEKNRHPAEKPLEATPVEKESPSPTENSTEQARAKKTAPEIVEQPFDELEAAFSAEERPAKGVTPQKNITLEEELKDTLPLEKAVTLFEKPTAKTSINERPTQYLQIGLNDRIAFVKNLFDGSQEDFNRVVSQLNTLKTEKEAKNFLLKRIKPDYDWTDKEEYEERFMSILERTFN